MLGLSIALNAQLTFTNVAGVGADASHIDFAKDGGCSFADYDLDGDLDLVVNTADNNSSRRSYLLRNDNGVFTDVTATVAPALKGDQNTERSVAWGDCNNDGYPDIMVNTFYRLKILINNGGTAFSLHTNITTMTDGINTEGTGWLDFDNDGDLDFFVENDSHGIEIFENDGSQPTPVFTQITIDAVGAAGTGSGGLGLPQGGSVDGDYATSVDLNNDGYVDIIARRSNNGVNNGQDSNPYDIFINDGDGTFTPMTTFNEEGPNNDKGAVLAGDFDNDGDFDVLWTSATTDSDLTVVYENTGNNSMNLVMVANPFLRDDGTAEAVTDFEGAAMGDIDNDGDLDVFLTQNTGAGRMYLNNSSGPGNFSFRQAGPTWIPGAALNYGIDVAGDGQGCVFADYDNDGDLDLYVNVNGSPNQLWRNDFIGSATEAAAPYQNNYLRVIAQVDVGGGVFRSAVNATIKFLDCDGNELGGIREVGSGGAGHGSQTNPWPHFGLSNGPNESYLVEVQFTRNGNTPVIVRKAVIPGQLPLLALGTSVLTLEQTIIVRDTDPNETSACVDSDSDGTPDLVDLDDDNDGIPDSEEGCGELIANGSFEVDDFTDPIAFPNGFTGANGTFIGTSFNTNTLTGWNYDLNLDGWVAGGGYGSNLFAPAFHGKQYVDIVGSSSYTGGAQTELWQDITTEPGKEYSFSFHWGEDIGHNAGQPVDIIARVIDSNGVDLINMTENILADGVVASVIGPKRWYHVTGNFIATTTSTRVLFTTTQPAGVHPGAGADLDLVSVRLADMADCADTDGDGYPDAMDLDSDNDGIYDLVEAGHGAADVNNDGIIDGTPADFGNNGLFNTLETITDNGVLNYMPADSDSDGNMDSIELDADNDLCFDVLEAGYTDPNGDGLLGNSPITVDLKGLVTSGGP